MKESCFGSFLLNRLKHGRKRWRRRLSEPMLALQVCDRDIGLLSATRRLTLFAIIDYNQLAHKKYQKLISELKPDLGQYAEKKLESIERAIRNGEDPSNIDAIANNVDYGSLDDKPSKEAIDKLVQGVKREIHTRETRSRERKEIQDDISWINEKNRVFNQKIARFYDKYTKEIRENLERGTAL